MNDLPCPLLPIRVDLPVVAEDPIDFSAFPTSPGLAAIEDEQARTILLVRTANLRRMIRSRLEPASEDAPRSRRADIRTIARRVCAAPIASSFEADWAYLQLARRRLPHSFAALLDRWRGWFIHVNPDTKFPRLVKTNTPGRAPTGRVGTYLGPFPDKHAAQRGIERLQDAFDLCRYHHILIEAPHATACVYKEMGRCPAPCDGTVSLASYHDQVRDAVSFVMENRKSLLPQLEHDMQAASQALEFERAEGLRRRFDAAKTFARPQHRVVRSLDAFRFLAVLPSEHPECARLMIIRGGWIEPFIDLAFSASKDDLLEVIDLVMRRARKASPLWSDAAIENTGLVCWHLFLPKKQNPPRREQFIMLPDELNAAALRRAIGRVASSPEESDTGVSIDEASLDGPESSVKEV